jgi:hypothetical protein
MKFTPFIQLLAVLGCVFTAAGCNRNERHEAEPLSGHYVNQTFLGTAIDSVPGLINTYCYEMDFVGPDSVKIFYGFEEATLSYEKSGNKYAVKKALQDKDLMFSIDDTDKLVLEDSSWKQNNENSTFIKLASTARGQWQFPALLNARMVAGSYEMFEKNKPTGQKVIFDKNGTVTGLRDFTSYELCFSGDCVGEVHPISNNITLSSATNSGSTYAFQFNRVKRILNIYNIEAPIKDIKGERGIKDIAFELHY